MKIDRVWHFYGSSHLPAQYRETPAGIEVSFAELAFLVENYDVMLHTDRDGKLVLALDVKGQRFHTR